MIFKITSRVLKRDFEFTAPDNGGYVRLILQAGEPGQQICVGGGMVGSTLTCRSNQDSFERVCRKWYRQHMRWQRSIGYSFHQSR